MKHCYYALGHVRTCTTQGRTLYFHPVDGRLVFAAALIIAALVLIGFALIADKCRCKK